MAQRINSTSTRVAAPVCRRPTLAKAVSQACSAGSCAGPLSVAAACCSCLCTRTTSRVSASQMMRRSCTTRHTHTQHTTKAGLLVSAALQCRARAIRRQPVQVGVRGF